MNGLNLGHKNPPLIDPRFEQQSSDLDGKLKSILESIIRDGQFVSNKEFSIFITEHFDPTRAENPMSARLDKANAEVKQAFIDAGWVAPGSYHDPSFKPQPLQPVPNKSPMPGIHGVDVYEVKVSHQFTIGDRVHDDEPETCWCWKEAAGLEE